MQTISRLPSLSIPSSAEVASNIIGGSFYMQLYSILQTNMLQRVNPPLKFARKKKEHPPIQLKMKNLNFQVYWCHILVLFYRTKYLTRWSRWVVVTWLHQAYLLWLRSVSLPQVARHLHQVQCQLTDPWWVYARSLWISKGYKTSNTSVFINGMT